MRVASAWPWGPWVWLPEQDFWQPPHILADQLQLLQVWPLYHGWWGGYVVGVQVINHKNRKKAEVEFSKRDIDFPVVIDPGETGAGSLFFPTTPGPKQLTLFGENEIPVLVFELEKTAIGALHLK